VIFGGACGERVRVAARGVVAGEAHQRIADVVIERVLRAFL